MHAPLASHLIFFVNRRELYRMGQELVAGIDREL